MSIDLVLVGIALALAGLVIHLARRLVQLEREMDDLRVELMIANSRTEDAWSVVCSPVPFTPGRDDSRLN